jgi:hypothetical protein
LIDSGPHKAGSEQETRFRESLGIPPEAIVILTLGASYKYAPLANLDFLATCNEVVKTVPEAFILAAGVNEDMRWLAASASAGGRLRALGSVSHEQVRLLHGIADLYIEGFPFGSTTALLEAGLSGLPVVLAPAECAPPYGSDGLALDDTLKRPASVDEYKAEIVRLCRDPAERASNGNGLRAAILMHHTGAGWKGYLRNALQGLPQTHQVHPILPPTRTPLSSYSYWSEFRETWAANNQGILEESIFQALSCGLNPMITGKLKEGCRSASKVRAGKGISLYLLEPLCNYLLPLLPISWRPGVFRAAEFLCRGGRIRRLRNKLNSSLWGIRDRSPSQQYREALISSEGTETKRKSKERLLRV